MYNENEQGRGRVSDWGYEEHIFPDPKYSFFVKKRVKSPQSRWVPHWHENIEIIYIVEGEANVSIDGELRYAKKGDIVVVNSSCMHRLYPIDTVVEYYVLIVSTKMCADIDINTKSEHLSPLISDEGARERAEAVVKSFSSGETYSLAQTKADLISLLVYLYRRFPAEEKKTTRYHISASKHIAQEAMEYIHMHYTEDITTSVLAKNLAVSVNYLCRCFNSCTGFTVIDHLNYVRCTAAKTMLSTTDYSVSEVCSAVGYNNLSYFGRQYKKFFGISPSRTERTGKPKM